MKKLLLILPILIIAGAAAWWFLLRTPAPEEGAAAVEEGPPVEFVELKPLTVPVVRQGIVERMVRVDVALELQASEAASKVTEALPRITDAFVVELYALLGHRLMEEENYDPVIIKRRLKGATERVVGPGLVSEVLIRGMAVAQGS
jgi:hypothetical protein